MGDVGAGWAEDIIMPKHILHLLPHSPIMLQTIWSILETDHFTFHDPSSHISKGTRVINSSLTVLREIIIH